MHLPPETIQEIKQRVKATDPDAAVILYGSFARGEGRPDSDIDLLILVDKPALSYAERTRFTYPLYEYAVQSDRLISPIVQTKRDWEEEFFYTPLYHNIKKEGIEL